MFDIPQDIRKFLRVLGFCFGQREARSCIYVYELSMRNGPDVVMCLEGTELKL